MPCFCRMTSQSEAPLHRERAVVAAVRPQGELLGTLQGSAEMELPRPPPRPVADAAEAARTRGAVEALAVAIRKASASVPEDQTHREQLGLELQQRPSSFTSSQPGARPLHRWPACRRASTWSQCTRSKCSGCFVCALW